MGPEEEVCRVSQEMPRPAPPREWPPLQWGLRVPKEESRMWAREPASLGGGCVYVGFACLFPKGRAAAVKTGAA